MKWVTRERLHVDRTACPWLIRRFVDPAAEFAFVAPGTDPRRVDGITFDMAGADYGHEGVKCTFEVILERHGLTGDPALVELGRIVRDADVPYGRVRRPESAGLDAILSGLREAVPDDQEKLRLSAPLYDGLYAYCRLKVAAGRAAGPGRPKLRYARRVAAHLAGQDEATAPDGSREASDVAATTRTVLFLCPHNALRSVIAAALFNRAAAGRARAESAGTDPDERVDERAIRVLGELGIDVPAGRPARVDRAQIERAERVVSLGCPLPTELAAVAAGKLEAWPLPDTTGRPVEAVRELRELIGARVARLLDELDRA